MKTLYDLKDIIENKIYSNFNPDKILRLSPSDRGIQNLKSDV